eukprot:3698427-Alexandrium_andersonii.AAC.1
MPGIEFTAPSERLACQEAVSAQLQALGIPRASEVLDMLFGLSAPELRGFAYSQVSLLQRVQEALVCLGETAAAHACG